ncbi:glycosyltransferase [Klenkia taihuensis]|nr:glycosyltransferase family 1 protein [Klenkia taihuensis]
MVRYAVEMARALAARDDIDLHVLVNGDGDQAFTGLELGGVHHTRGGGQVGAALEGFSGMTTGWRGFDVVHGTKHLLPWRVVGTRVLTVHDMLVLDRPRDFGLAKRALVRTPYLAALRSADLLVCVSRATRRRVVDYLPETAGRTAVVGHATRSALRDQPAAEVPALTDRRFALVVGDPSPRKNLRTVVDAWPGVMARDPDAVLAVVGPSGWGTTDRGVAFDRLVADGHVLPLGHVPDPELRWLYENAATVLCPSIAEGFGLPASEALELGARVISSEDPALAEAAAGRAQVVSGRRPQAWTEAVVAHLSAPPDDGADVDTGSGRDWDQVADETVAAIRQQRGRL